MNKLDTLKVIRAELEYEEAFYKSLLQEVEGSPARGGTHHYFQQGFWSGVRYAQKLVTKHLLVAETENE